MTPYAADNEDDKDERIEVKRIDDFRREVGAPETNARLDLLNASINELDDDINILINEIEGSYHKPQWHA